MDVVPGVPNIWRVLPTASTRTILAILPRRRRSVKVMATTPAGLSGAAPAAVNTHLRGGGDGVGGGAGTARGERGRGRG